MAAQSEKLKLGILQRSFALTRNTFDKEKRTVRVKFSSEAPVKRWFGDEILDHSAASVDLSRMKAGAAVLMEHDTNQRCGITESAELMPDKTGEAVVRFARTPMGDQCMAEVEDSTLRWLSVGYRVNKFLVDEETEQYRAVSWEPLEVSFVAIPADPSARVMRNQTQVENEPEIMFINKRSIQLDAAPAVGGGGPAIVTKEDFSRQLDEAQEIFAVTMQFQRTHPAIIEEGKKAIKDKTPLADFMRKAMEIISTKPVEVLNAGGFAEAEKPKHRGDLTIGQRLVASEGYRAAVKAAKTGSKNALRGISLSMQDEYQFKPLSYAESIRATFSATTEGISGTSGVNIQAVQGVPGILDQQPLYISQLFSQGATGADTIRYIIEDAYTNAATRVAEGGTKPAATLDVSVVNATVEKTAVTVKVTDEMLSDFQQMQSFVNNRLGYMVQALEDQQLLTGTGSSQIKGVLNFSGLQTLSGAVNPIDALAKAIEYVRGANGSGFAQPDAIVMHPLDWLNVKLTKDSNGQYLFGGPGYAPYGTGGYSNVSNAWGLPVVSTTSMTRGTALVGAFRMAAQIWRRQGLTIETTNSNEDDFLKNLVAVRAEQRMGLTVYQPNKFCTVTSIPA
jgi:HK97 family phage major capsid protein/HK97 family phage prohead protease